MCVNDSKLSASRGKGLMCIMYDNETIRVLFAYHIVKIYVCVET